MRIKRIWIVIMMLSLLTGCGANTSSSEISPDNNKQDAYTREIEAMDTVMSLTAYGQNGQKAVEEAIEEIYSLDHLLSTGDPQSEIYQINHTGGGVLSDTTAKLIEQSMELYHSTDGLFDIAIYPLMDAWGFTNQNYHVPTEAEMESLLKQIDANQIVYDQSKKEVFFKRNDMAIDLGGIAKGYTSSRIMEIYKACGVTSGMVSLGGNVHVLGTKEDGSLWRVGIRNPKSQDDYLGVLSVADCAVITSGGYERFFEEDGVTYHHIIDPRTGYPADSGLLSVTIVSEDGTLADALSTSLFIMGIDQAKSFWQKNRDQFDFVIFDGKTIFVTEKLADAFHDATFPTEIVKAK